MLLTPSNVGWPCCVTVNLDAAYRFFSDATKGDDSKNNYDLTTAGTPSWASYGKNNGCIQLVGSNDEVNNAALLDSNDFSISNWFQCETYLTAGDTIHPMGIIDNDDATKDLEIVLTATGNQANHTVKLLKNGTTSSALFSGQTFDLSSFVFFALVVDQDSNVRVCVNDQKETVSGTTGHAGAETFRCLPNASGYTQISVLDEFYVDNDALWTDAQIDFLYNNGAGRFVDANGNF